MCLWACGAPQSFRQCKNKFCRSLQTVSRNFAEVLDSIMRLAFDIVRPKDPQFGTIHLNCKRQGSGRISKIA